MEELVEGERCVFEEDNEHEFKIAPATNLITQYATITLNAFLNSNGGTLYFGIDNKGLVKGIPCNFVSRDTFRLTIDTVIRGIVPQIDPRSVSLHYYPVRLKNLRSLPHFVLAVQIQRGMAPVYFTPKREAYVRYSASNYPLSVELINERLRLYHGLQPSMPDQILSPSESGNILSQLRAIQSLVQNLIARLESRAPEPPSSETAVELHPHPHTYPEPPESQVTHRQKRIRPDPSVVEEADEEGLLPTGPIIPDGGNSRSSSETHHCALCRRDFTDANSLQQHKESCGHKRRVLTHGGPGGAPTLPPAELKAALLALELDQATKKKSQLPAGTAHPPTKTPTHVPAAAPISHVAHTKDPIKPIPPPVPLVDLETAWGCPTCGHNFRTRRAYQAHRREAHISARGGSLPGILLVHCPHCQKFLQKDKLRKHITKVHKSRQVVVLPEKRRRASAGD
ncbi:hypothetical protein PAPYR_5096 [Paratrimastix pyriformis]|uniref:C2H2-type domain-containing protein n=1 Tax=Paratrimastix pyriformis TaxID=342808 RepID=A0ABQ8UIJ4_9EUKA|nr:hypothetical protein PAPYR_5096 [Paratrimastix pyriformis]